MQDPDGGNSHVALECASQKPLKHDFDHFRSLEELADGTIQLARCDLVLVFYGEPSKSEDHNSQEAEVLYNATKYPVN